MNGSTAASPSFWTSGGAVRGPRSAAVRIVGAERTARVYEMCDLLQRHDMPFAFHAADSAGRRRDPRSRRVSRRLTPVVVLQDGRALVDPSNVEIAERARCTHSSRLRDLRPHRRRGGPAGLSAAVYAESEGLRTALDRTDGDGGPGRNELDDPQLPRVSTRHQRRRTGGPRGRPSHPVRDRDDLRQRRR